jgi:hypothetical protein
MLDRIRVPLVVKIGQKKEVHSGIDAWHRTTDLGLTVKTLKDVRREVKVNGQCDLVLENGKTIHFSHA